MRRETINCDRCGKILKDEARPLSITEWDTRFGRLEAKSTILYDLCPECQREFEKFITDYERN